MDLDLVTGDNDNVRKSHEVRNDFMRFFYNIKAEK